MNGFKCTEKNCNGQVIGTNSVTLMTGCSSSSIAYACDSCGALFWPDGIQVYNRQQKRTFLIDGIIEFQDEKKD